MPQIDPLSDFADAVKELIDTLLAANYDIHQVRFLTALLKVIDKVDSEDSASLKEQSHPPA